MPHSFKPPRKSGTGNSLRFYAQLNDFIAPAYRDQAFEHVCQRRTSVKDYIEAFGVPHIEVELIMVNGQAVDFSYIVQAGDQIQVYLESTGVIQGQECLLRPALQSIPKFVIDANLGRLARYLRLLGFNCLYRNDFQDQEIARIASRQQCIVLTRNRSLLRRKIITYGYFLRSDNPKLQVREVMNRFDLHDLSRPFSRCTRCNGTLIETTRQNIEL